MIKIAILIVVFMIGIMPAWADVYIQNDQKYVSSDGLMHIMGEIQNDLEMPLNQATVDVFLYSKSNQVLDKIKANSMIYNIMPGMKSPFDVIIPADKAKKVEGYAFDLSYKVSSPKNQALEISSSDIFYDVLGNSNLKGAVTNNGKTTANIISIVATFYDSNGDVAYVSKSQTEPDYLKSNGKSYFVIPIPREFSSKNPIDYSIVAESEEFAAAPEFPIGSSVLLASSVGSYLILTRFSNKLIANFVSASDPR